MRANRTYSRVTSACGEHLIAVLVVVIAIMGIMTAYPALAAKTRTTADRAQHRADMPLIVASELDKQAASPHSP
jgi:hypothetical protein